MKLYHSSFSIITDPDLKHGRVNADFGQGFYLSPDKEFVLRWSKRHYGKKTYINEYELDTENLDIWTFVRDTKWLSYILHNRSRLPDSLKTCDAILGPIANDTIYDTWGIISSGLFPEEETLQLGPEYKQLVVKSEKALKQLKWIDAEELSDDLLSRYKETVRKEEQDYQTAFSKLMEELDSSAI